MPRGREEVKNQAAQEKERHRTLVIAAIKVIKDFLEKNPDKMFTCKEIEDAVDLPDSIRPLLKDEGDKHRAVVAALVNLNIHKKIDSEVADYINYYGHKQK